MTAPTTNQVTEPVRVIDVSTIPCPCCAEIPWCREEVATAALDVARAPEVVMAIGTATYGTGRRWVR